LKATEAAQAKTRDAMTKELERLRSFFHTMGFDPKVIENMTNIPSEKD
jgi:hypothetical protein